VIHAGLHIIGVAGVQLVRQIGIGEQLAPHRYEVTSTFADQPLAELWRDAPDSDHRHGYMSLDLARVLDEMPGK
jgi:hypothetical protein